MKIRVETAIENDTMRVTMTDENAVVQLSITPLTDAQLSVDSILTLAEDCGSLVNAVEMYQLRGLLH